jgi:hypothetical protein
MIDVTPKQNAQCMLVQQEALELIGRLAGEGFEWATITAGVSAALAATVMSVAGADAVEPFFMSHAVLAKRIGVG